MFGPTPFDETREWMAVLCIDLAVGTVLAVVSSLTDGTARKVQGRWLKTKEWFKTLTKTTIKLLMIPGTYHHHKFYFWDFWGLKMPPPWVDSPAARRLPAALSPRPWAPQGASAPCCRWRVSCLPAATILANNQLIWPQKTAVKLKGCRPHEVTILKASGPSFDKPSSPGGQGPQTWLHPGSNPVLLLQTNRFKKNGHLNPSLHDPASPPKTLG